MERATNRFDEESLRIDIRDEISDVFTMKNNCELVRYLYRLRINDIKYKIKHYYNEPTKRICYQVYTRYAIITFNQEGDQINYETNSHGLR